MATARSGLEARLLGDLAALGITHDVHEHAAVFTVEESRSIKQHIPGEHTKNLFLKDSAGQFWLLTAPADLRVDLKALPRAIGCRRVSFGKQGDMERLIAVRPGSVTPLGAIAAPPGSIGVVIDSRLASAARVNVHPLRNDATIGISGPDLLRALRHWGHDPMVVAIPQMAGGWQGRR